MTLETKTVERFVEGGGCEGCCRILYTPKCRKAICYLHDREDGKDGHFETEEITTDEA